jgi:hypothetical protein
MGARGPGANPFRLVVSANNRTNISPSRRRQAHRRALDRLWEIERPPNGSRYKKFEAACVRVARCAGGLGIDDAVFREWTESVRFEVDDRDDEVDL